VIAKILKAKPEQSNRQIAKQVKVDHKTVGAIRAEGEGRGEIPHVEARTDTKGRKQPSAKPKKSVKKAGEAFDVMDYVTGGAVKSTDFEHHITASPEVNTEECKAQNAQLDPPAAEETIDEVERRVICVFNTIQRHVEGFSHEQTERFFALLQDMVTKIGTRSRRMLALPS